MVFLNFPHHFQALIDIDNVVDSPPLNFKPSWNAAQVHVHFLITLKMLNKLLTQFLEAPFFAVVVQDPFLSTELPFFFELIWGE